MKNIIPILKQVINALEKDIVKYDWTKQESCNCGLVAQAVLNVHSTQVKDMFSADIAQFIGYEIKEEVTYKDEPILGFIPNKTKKVERVKIPKINATWKNVAKASCSVTGLSMSTVIRALNDAGFRAEDIVHIEFLENKAILANSDIDTSEVDYYSKKENLIKYFKSWVQILENKDKTNKQSNQVKLEKDLLRAVNEEKYEEASRLRDQIAELI